LSTHSPSDHDAVKARLIDSIMDIESPWWRIHDAIIKAVPSTAQALNQTPTTAEARKIAAHRATLQAMDMDSLQQRHGTVKKEKERRDEAGRFYNQAKAMADYAYWLSLDFWTQDEAIALLLGRNPEIVTWDAVDKTMRPPKRFMGPVAVSTPFLQLFERLRHAAQRSEAMTASPKLKPEDVARWGNSKLGERLPKQLQALLTNEAQAGRALPEAAATNEHSAATQDEPVLVKRKALTNRADLWPTVESDLRNSATNGLGEAAKADEYGMWKESEALEWARRRGKLTKEGRPLEADSFKRMVHKLSG
jgi:hypothetical protein